MFRGVECREPLALEPTPPNIRFATRRRAEVLSKIERGTFNYGDEFPESENARRFGYVPSGALVGAELDKWFGQVKLAASTRLTYGRVIDAYLRPWFGNVRMRDLTAGMIRDRAIAELLDGVEEEERVTLKTARNVLTPLGAMLQRAFEDDKITANPMAKVHLERHWPDELAVSDWQADPFAFDEMEAIFAKCAGGPEGEEADYWRFAFGTGMRPSEQIAFAWPKVDLLHFRGRVDVARVTGSAKPGAKRRTASALKAPKTRAGVRDIEFTRGAWDALERQQARTRLAGREVWRDPRSLAPWASEEVLRKRFAAILATAGVRYRNPYQTRHTFGSVLLSAGYDELWVARQMGHSSVEMLRRHYGHWIDQGGDPARREALAAFFSHVSPAVATAGRRILPSG
jgi:integrase